MPKLIPLLYFLTFIAYSYSPANAIAVNIRVGIRVEVKVKVKVGVKGCVYILYSYHACKVFLSKTAILIVICYIGYKPSINSFKFKRGYNFL